MNKESLTLSISIYQNQTHKNQAIQLIKSLHKDGEKILAAIAIDKALDGKIHYKDIGMTPQKGALSGLVLGAVIGVLTGGTGLVIGTAGGLIGSLVGSRKYQNRFSEVRLHELIAGLQPGTSTVVTLAQNDSLPTLEAYYTSVDAEFFQAELTDDLTEKLDQIRQHNRDSDWTDHIAE